MKFHIVIHERKASLLCARNVHLSYPPVFDRPDVTSREGWPMALYRCLSWLGTYVCAVVVVFYSSSIPHDDYHVVFNIVILYGVHLQHTHHIPHPHDNYHVIFNIVRLHGVYIQDTHHPTKVTMRNFTL